VRPPLGDGRYHPGAAWPRVARADIQIMRSADVVAGTSVGRRIKIIEDDGGANAFCAETRRNMIFSRAGLRIFFHDRANGLLRL